MLVAQTIYRRGKGAQTHRAAAVAAAVANCKGRLEFRKCLHGLPSRVELTVELRDSGGKCELHTHTTHNQHGCSAPLSCHSLCTALSSMTVRRAAAFVVHLQNLRLFRVRIITWQHKSVACQQAHTQNTH